MQVIKAAFILFCICFYLFIKYTYFKYIFTDLNITYIIIYKHIGNCCFKYECYLIFSTYLLFKLFFFITDVLVYNYNYNL